MGNVTKPSKMRWFLLAALTLSSIVFTGCEKGSLGVKNGCITGYVLDDSTNLPIPDVLLRGEGDQHIIREGMTGGDGAYIISEVAKGPWQIRATKFGYIATPTDIVTNGVSATVENGATVNAPVIRMAKTDEAVKGVLKGYPVDAITGAPLTNFTITQISPAKQKKFETAQDFKESGWSGLEGGEHSYKLTCDNYNPLTLPITADGAAATLKISKTPYDLGVIKVDPLKVSITGTLRNLPGYILGTDKDQAFNGIIWAEAAGRVVASSSAAGDAGGGAFNGTVIYTIADVPVTAGTVAIKCKLRGYDVITINPSVAIPAARPSGSIAGIDCNFESIEPIKRDIRVIVTGTKPAGDDPGSFRPGQRARVYIQEGGKDLVPYVDVICTDGFYAEAYFSQVEAGWEVTIMAVNLTEGYYTGKKEKVRILEDGGTVYTTNISLSSGGLN